MTFSISADTDNHRYNPIFISADTDKKPIQIFLYRPIPIPITDITSYVIHAFFIMLNVHCLASKLGDAGGVSAPSLFCPPWGFLLLITMFFGVKSPSCTSTIYLPNFAQYDIYLVLSHSLNFACSICVIIARAPIFTDFCYFI